MTMMLMAFKLQLDVKKNIDNSIASSLRPDKDQKYKEHLFTYFKKELLRNNVIVNRESIMNFLNMSDDNLRVNFEEALLTFDKAEQQLLIISPYDSYYDKIDYYNISVEDGELMFFIGQSKIERK
jgi:hypothetical protein